MLRIGIVGVGHLGKIHIKCIKSLPEYTLAGFFDIDENTSEQVEQEFGIKQFASVEELIDAVDVVDIVTPTAVHFQVALAALNKFRHVFIEKPVVATPAQALELIERASLSGVKVQVGHVERFNPAMIAARPYISNPMFIEAHRLSKFSPRGAEVPVVLDLMIHDIDIVLNLVKSDITRISASGVAVLSPTADIANARLEFANGCVANLTASRLSLNPMRKTRIFQHNAYIAVDFLNKKSEVISLSAAGANGNHPPVPAFSANPGNGQIHFESLKIEDTNAIQHELASFAASILQDTPPEVSVQEGYQALDVAFRILDKVQLSVNKFNP